MCLSDVCRRDTFIRCSVDTRKVVVGSESRSRQDVESQNNYLMVDTDCSVVSLLSPVLYGRSRLFDGFLPHDVAVSFIE